MATALFISDGVWVCLIFALLLSFEPAHDRQRIPIGTDHLMRRRSIGQRLEAFRPCPGQVPAIGYLESIERNVQRHAHAHSHEIGHACQTKSVIEAKIGFHFLRLDAQSSKGSGLHNNPGNKPQISLNLSAAFVYNVALPLSIPSNPYASSSFRATPLTVFGANRLKSQATAGSHHDQDQEELIHSYVNASLWAASEV